jgi:hypothetical protein
VGPSVASPMKDAANATREVTVFLAFQKAPHVRPLGTTKTNECYHEAARMYVGMKKVTRATSAGLLLQYRARPRSHEIARPARAPSIMETDG